MPLVLLAYISQYELVAEVPFSASHQYEICGVPSEENASEVSLAGY